MRRRKEQAAKLKVKIFEDRKAGLTYQEIERKRGASSRTIADLVKGKDPKKYCQECGETDPEKLQEHHPDKVNDPSTTVTLCASCHSKVTREEQRKRTKETEKDLVGSKTTVPESLQTKQNLPTQAHPGYTQMEPVPPEVWRWLGKYGLYSSSGIALAEAICDKRLPQWLRWFLGIGGLACFYGGSRIK